MTTQVGAPLGRSLPQLPADAQYLISETSKLLGTTKAVQEGLLICFEKGPFLRMPIPQGQIRPSLSPDYPSHRWSSARKDLWIAQIREEVPVAQEVAKYFNSQLKAIEAEQPSENPDFATAYQNLGEITKILAVTTRWLNPPKPAPRPIPVARSFSGTFCTIV